MSLFSDALAGGLAAIARIAGDPVSYSTGEVTVALTGVVPGTTRYEALTSNNTTVVAESADFIVERAQLVSADDPIIPVPGHRLVHQGRTYEVLPLGDNEPCWRFSDPGHTRLRIHTKDVTP